MTKYRSPIQPLLLKNVGEKPSLPTPLSAMPGDEDFLLDQNLMIGQMAYNIPDDKWYYRGKNNEIKILSSLEEVRYFQNEFRKHVVDKNMHLSADNYTLRSNNGEIRVNTSALYHDDLRGKSGRGTYHLSQEEHTRLVGVIPTTHGGTGAVNSINARRNLGLEIGKDIQAYDEDLDTIANLKGEEGLLRKKAQNSWELDATKYAPESDLHDALTISEKSLDYVNLKNQQLNLEHIDLGKHTKGKLLKEQLPDNASFSNLTLQNQAVRNADAVRLDQLNSALLGQSWQAPVEDIKKEVPSELVEGNRYLIADSALGIWQGKSRKIAQWNNNEWKYLTPKEGWVIWVKDIDTNYNFNGNEWVEFGSTLTHNNTMGLQGGTTQEYYHLSKSEYDKLSSLAVDKILFEEKDPVYTADKPNIVTVNKNEEITGEKSFLKPLKSGRGNNTCVFIGANVGGSNVSNHSTVIGCNTLKNISEESTYNTILGSGAFINTTEGNHLHTRNTIVGCDSFVIRKNTITHGDLNVAIGSRSLFHAEGYNNESSICNMIALGSEAGFYVQGKDSILIGSKSGLKARTNKSIFIGYGAGSKFYGENNIVLGNGNSNRLNSVDVTNTIVLGNDIEPDKNNLVVLGNSKNEETYTDGTFNTSKGYQLRGVKVPLSHFDNDLGNFSFSAGKLSVNSDVETDNEGRLISVPKVYRTNDSTVLFNRKISSSAFEVNNQPFAFEFKKSNSELVSILTLDPKSSTGSNNHSTVTIHNQLNVQKEVNAPVYNVTSDVRLKKNIEFAKNLDWVDDLQIVSYQMKSDDSEKKRYGLIAQEVEKVAKNLVSKNQENYRSVDYTGYLMAKCARQDQLIAELSARITKIEK